MHKINKTILTIPILTFTLPVNATTELGFLGFINNNAPVLYKDSVVIDMSLLNSWMFLSHVLFFVVLTFLIIISYRSFRKSKKLNEKMVHVIRTVYNLQKPLELIRGPLEDLSKDDSLNDAQKIKLHLAIGSTSKIQNTVDKLIEQEKTDIFFQHILKSLASRRIHLRERMESKIISYKQQKGLDIPDSKILPGKEIQADQMFMERLMEILKTNLEDTNFTIDTLSQKIGMSRSSLYHKIKNITGMAPADFIRQYRMERAKELLTSNQYTISEVAYKTGFADVKYFRTVFKKQYKTTPKSFSKMI